MRRSSSKRVCKVPAITSEDGKEVFQRCGSCFPMHKEVNIKPGIPSFGDSIRPKQPQSLPRKVLSSKLGKTRIVGGIYPKSMMNVSSNKLPLKSRNVIMSKLPTPAVSLLRKKVGSSSIASGALMQREKAAPQFMSILTPKGRLVTRKATTPLVGRRIRWNAEETNRLSYVKRLQLFQALLKEPLSFLELHGRFGVSKQTIRALVRNGFFTEIWGPKAIGVRFKLSKKGKIYLREFESAAKLEPKIMKKAFIHLKHLTQL